MRPGMSFQVAPKHTEELLLYDVPGRSKCVSARLAPCPSVSTERRGRRNLNQ